MRLVGELRPCTLKVRMFKAAMVKFGRELEGSGGNL